MKSEPQGEMQMLRRVFLAQLFVQVNVGDQPGCKDKGGEKRDSE